MNPVAIKAVVMGVGAFLGLVLAITLPAAAGLGEGLSAFIGMIIFAGSVFSYQLYTETEADDVSVRLKKLEDDNAAMKTELAKTRDDVTKKTQTSDAKNEKVVSELKLLQTLLGQVMKKEMALKGDGIKGANPSKTKVVRASAAAKKPAPAKPTAPKSDKKPAPKDILGEADTVAAYLHDSDDIDEDDIILDNEVETEPGIAVREDAAPARAGQTKAAPAARKKAAIRLIKKEDQLLSVIQNSLAENRVDLYLQGIVGLPSRKISHYECFSRVRDEEGRIVLPRQYIKLAESRGLIGTIDNLLLFRLIQLVRRLGPRRPDIRFFCNLSLHSMRDQEFFPQFIDFMQANEEFASRLIFEISQADYQSLEGDVTDQLARLGRRGFGFSLDHVASVDDDLFGLGKDNFQFAKMDMSLLTETMEIKEIQELVGDLRQKGISLIASRMEHEDMVLQALDAQIELAQGYLFGEPKASSELNREL